MNIFRHLFVSFSCQYCIRTLPRGGMHWEIHPPRTERSPEGGDFTPRGRGSVRPFSQHQQERTDFFPWRQMALPSATDCKLFTNIRGALFYDQLIFRVISSVMFTSKLFVWFLFILFQQVSPTGLSEPMC